MRNPPQGLFRKIFTDLRSRFYDTRRAFREFLAFPTLIVSMFLLLSIGTYLFEHSQYQFTSPVYAFFKARVFVNAEATSDLLGNIAGSIITVTSITITLLLLIVQQSANNLTTQVFDQFLRRRSNQLTFGYFVGIAVYTLITLALVDDPFNPVLSASLVFLFTVIAMFMLFVLFYSTIHQMRPPVILGAIHNHALSARRRQQALLRQTRRESLAQSPETVGVRSNLHGFVTAVHLSELYDIVKKNPNVQEIILNVSIGSFIAYQDTIAEIKGIRLDADKDLQDDIRDAIQLERSRDLEADPAYAVKQIEMIAWAVTSPSKSSLGPGLHAIYTLRDLLARWAADACDDGEEEEPVPIVYNDDVVGTLIHAFESLAVAAAVSKEHQVASEILDALAGLFDRLPPGWQEQAEDAILRLLPTVEAHVLTANLEAAMDKLIDRLAKADRQSTAAEARRMLNHMHHNRLGRI